PAPQKTSHGSTSVLCVSFWYERHAHLTKVISCSLLEPSIIGLSRRCGRLCRRFQLSLAGCTRTVLGPPPAGCTALRIPPGRTRICRATTRFLRQPAPARRRCPHHRAAADSRRPRATIPSDSMAIRSAALLPFPPAAYRASRRRESRDRSYACSRAARGDGARRITGRRLFLAGSRTGAGEHLHVRPGDRSH